MTSKELNTLLLDTFPNLSIAYEEEVEWQEGDNTGSHTVYGDVFVPYVVSCIENNKKEDMKKIFSYIELLLTKEDSYTDEVVAFSVLESIEYLLNENQAILAILGDKTLAIYKELRGF